MSDSEHISQDMPAGIKVSGVNVSYKNGNVALENVNFETPSGTITALVGMNGSGKSTLFKSIMGFMPIQSGEIRILGLSTREALQKKLVAYVPQSEEVDWDFPVLVRDVVMMGRYGHMNWLRRSRPQDHQAVDIALKRVGMADFSKRQIGELSGGQRKRVFLARALAQNARVILLDEPFTGVDVSTEDAIINLLGQLRDEGHVILVSTHNLGSVPEFCDHSVLLNRTVIAYGLTKDVFTRANLKIAFGGMLRHFVINEGDKRDRQHVNIISDDERPLVFYDETATARHPSNEHEQGSEP